MKKIGTIVAILSLVGAVAAQAGEKCCPLTAAKKAAAAKAECAASGKDTVKFAVSGMTCGGCEGKIKTALGKMDGVTVNKVCSKSGCAELTFDGSKVKKADVMKTINDSGFKITGEQASFKVAGMTCGGSAGKVMSTLAAIDGVEPTKVCHQSGTVNVTLDPAKTSKDQVAAAITGSGLTIQ